MSKLDDASEAALKQVLANPDIHARFNRASAALLAVSSIEDPNPLKAVGHMFGSAVEYLVNLGVERQFILDFAGQLYDTLKSEDGEKLRQAARRQQG